MEIWSDEMMEILHRYKQPVHENGSTRGQHQNHTNARQVVPTRFMIVLIMNYS